MPSIHVTIDNRDNQVALENYYQRMLKDIHERYHRYPKGPATRNSYKLTDDEKAELAWGDAQGRYDASHL